MDIKIRSITIALAAMSISTGVYADEDYFYLGGQFGQTNTHNVPREVLISSTPPTTVLTSPSNTGMGGRVYLGYTLGRYAAMEAGFTHYATSVYDVELANCGNPGIRENAVDFVGKATYPISQFRLFAKAGIAIVRVSLSGSLSPSETLSSCNTNGSTNNVRPLIGLGVGYQFTPNWGVDLTASRITGGGNVKDADLLALGVTYSIVDHKCGQFLC